MFIFVICEVLQWDIYLSKFRLCKKIKPAKYNKAHLIVVTFEETPVVEFVFCIVVPDKDTNIITT